VNDSITQIRIGISEKNKAIYNRLTAPFFNTKFKKISLELIKNYKKGIEFNIKENFRVHSIGVDSIPSFDFIYIGLKNIKMRDKASQMMKNNAFILEFMSENNIVKEGLPIIIVEDWDLEENTLDYKFGFQIKYRDNLPMDSDIKFGSIKSKKALKAIYNGNYIGSDKAWFALYEYAIRHNIEVDLKPIEIFYNNPFMGGDELDWIAEIYLPIK
jgi:effector-binding domain-containing protein